MCRRWERGQHAIDLAAVVPFALSVCRDRPARDDAHIVWCECTQPNGPWNVDSRCEEALTLVQRYVVAEGLMRRRPVREIRPVREQRPANQGLHVLVWASPLPPRTR